MLEVVNPEQHGGIGGKQKTFQILGPNETDPANGRISYKSPLGAALINLREGDTVKINPPDCWRAPKWQSRSRTVLWLFCTNQ